jgi:aminomethyltransferase
MTTTLLQTPLHDWHVAHGARMVDFAGWSMPVQYVSIVQEHVATRTEVGLFDISHMGRLRFSGAAAADWLDRLVTRRASKLSLGHVAYCLVTNDQGGVKDDVLVYHLADGAGERYYLMVVNASNRQKILQWIEAHRDPDSDARVADVTFDWGMIAVQGPRAVALLEPLVEADLRSMKYYTGVETRIGGHGGIISRTGYTGEDGFELILGLRGISLVWERLFARGNEGGPTATPAGLGARDTLRLEAGMPLYGHELSEEINPFQAGLGFAVELEDARFPGAAALTRAKANALQPRRVGLELAGKRPAREGCLVHAANGSRIGEVTSGTFSPTFQRPLAMAYIDPQFSAPGTSVLVEIRGRRESARVTRLPFYRRKS